MADWLFSVILREPRARTQNVSHLLAIQARGHVPLTKIDRFFVLLSAKSDDISVSPISGAPGWKEIDRIETANKRISRESARNQLDETDDVLRFSS